MGYRITNRNNEVMHITHLFADDTLVFCRCSIEEMVHFNWNLLWFEAILELRINLEKRIALVVGEWDAFFALIEKAVSLGFLMGYRITNRNNEVMHITHLLFADDTLVFCRCSMEEMVHLNWLLLWFEAILELRINLEKSIALVVGELENLDELTLELGCKTGTLSTIYLGLTLVMRRNSISVWDGVEERFRKKLTLWKGQFISNGGRLTLI